MRCRKLKPKQINPYLDFVLGLDATQFDLLCDAINQRKDRERYGATSFEEVALNYGRKPICPKCLSDKYHEDGYTPSLAKRYRCENCDLYCKLPIFLERQLEETAKIRTIKSMI